MSELPRILIVDDSRVVRKSLKQKLAGHFDIREEADGEAAWQTLVLDHSIQVVISDLQMPKLDGFQLLERIRSSKLNRLKLLPFILVSGEESEEERRRAFDNGVSDFLTKGVGSDDLLERLIRLVNSAQDNRSQTDSDQMGLSATGTSTSGAVSRMYLGAQASQILSQHQLNGEDVSVMVIGFDNFEDLVARLGMHVVEEVGKRFARMLADKMRKEDILGNYAAGQYAVISPGTAPSFCAAFAERVRQAVEIARLSAHGQSVALTVSIGIASASVDGQSSASALLDLASDRMVQATRNGGNRIETGGDRQTRHMTLQHALQLLAAGRNDLVLPHLSTLGSQLLPLLQLLDQELKLTLPLGNIKRALRELHAASKKRNG